MSVNHFTLFPQEFELPFIKLAATEVVSGVSGESEEKIRDLFDKAEVGIYTLMFVYMYIFLSTTMFFGLR